MKRHLYETASGITLQIDYTRPNGVVEFHSIRALDADYRESGPDLSEFLHGLVQLDPASDPINPSGERLLSVLVKEIEENEQGAAQGSGSHCGGAV